MKSLYTKIVFLLLSVFFLFSCGKHLPADKYPNPASSGYHRMEFDIIKNGVSKKEIGIGNISVKEDEDTSQVYFKIYGLYKGTLYMKSDACGIDFSTRFDGITTYKLDDLVYNLNKCSIKITAETDKIKNKQHNIVETGVIKLNVIPTKDLELEMEYSRTNASLKSLYQTYSFLGQGSIQRQEGDLTSSESFKVKTNLTIGGYYRVAGCDKVIAGTFDKDYFDVSLKNLYAKSYLKREDTCDFEIIIIPNEILNTYQGRFSINIYGKEVVKLEPLEWKIKKVLGKNRLYVWGGDHILSCGINNSVKIKNKYDVKYSPDQVYWIRSLTTNARKNVFAIKNGNIIWRE